jgi:hypothetical protein
MILWLVGLTGISILVKCGLIGRFHMQTEREGPIGNVYMDTRAE